MDRSLSHFLLDYEREHFGNHGIALNGDAFLSSELQWLNRYIAEMLEQNFNLNYLTQLHFDNLQTENWSYFSNYIYQHDSIQKVDLGKITQKTISFLKWLKIQLPEKSPEILLAEGALKMGKKEVTRLLKIHQHFSALIHSRVYIPEPTEEPELIELNEAFSQSQFEETHSKFHEDFEVVSKNKKLEMLYLKGVEQHRAIVLKVDSLLVKKIAVGDRFPLTLGLTKSQQTLLLNYGYPLFQKKFDE